MCNPVALSLLVASQGVDYYNQKQAQDRTEEQIGLAENRNDEFNDKMISESDKNMAQYDPTARVEKLAESQADNEGSMTQRLTDARDNQDANSPAAQGKVSATYTNDKAERAIKRAKASSDLAKQLSKINAPSLLQNEEAMNNADSSVKMGTTSQHRGDMQNASFADIKNAGELDATMQMVSGMLRGAGMMYGGGGNVTATGTF